MEMAQQHDLIRRSLISPFGATSSGTTPGRCSQHLEQEQLHIACPEDSVHHGRRYPQPWSTTSSLDLGLPQRHAHHNMPFASLSAPTSDFRWIIPHGSETLPMHDPAGTVAPHQTMLNDKRSSSPSDVPMLASAPDLPRMTAQKQQSRDEQYTYPVEFNMPPFSMDDVSEDEKQMLRDINFRYEPPELIKSHSPLATSFELEGNAMAINDLGTEEDPLVANNPLLKQATHRNGKPKRPLNAFMIFARQRRPELQKLRGKIGVKEIGTLLSTEWRLLTPEQKRPYKDGAAVVRENFHRLYPNYVYQRRTSGIRPKKRLKRSNSISSGNESIGSDIIGEVLDASAPISSSATDSDMLCPTGGQSSGAESSAASFSPRGGVDTLSRSVNTDVLIGSNGANQVDRCGLIDPTVHPWHFVPSVANQVASPFTPNDTSTKSMTSISQATTKMPLAEQSLPQESLEYLSKPRTSVFGISTGATAAQPPSNHGMPTCFNHQIGAPPLRSYAMSRTRNGSQGSLSSEGSVSATYNPNSVTKLARHLSMQCSDTEVSVPLSPKMLNQPGHTCGKATLAYQRKFSTYIPSPAFAKTPEPQSFDTTIMARSSSWQDVRSQAQPSDTAETRMQQYKYGNMPGFPSSMVYLPPGTAPAHLGQLRFSPMSGYPLCSNPPHSNNMPSSASSISSIAPLPSQSQHMAQAGRPLQHVPLGGHARIQPGSLHSLFCESRTSTAAAPYHPSVGAADADGPPSYNGNGARRASSFDLNSIHSSQM